MIDTWIICSDLQHIGIKTPYSLLNKRLELLRKVFFSFFPNIHELNMYIHFGNLNEEMKPFTKYEQAAIWLILTIRVSKQPVDQLH